VLNGKVKIRSILDIKSVDNMTIWLKLAQTFDTTGLRSAQIGSNPLKNNVLDLRIQLLSTF
jgi:hypothetical protein